MSNRPSQEINVGSHQWRMGNTRNSVVPRRRQSRARSSLEVNLQIFFNLALINFKASSILLFLFWFPRRFCCLLVHPIRQVRIVIIGDDDYRVGLSQQKIDITLLAKTFSHSVSVTSSVRRKCIQVIRRLVVVWLPSINTTFFSSSSKV